MDIPHSQSSQLEPSIDLIYLLQEETEVTEVVQNNKPRDFKAKWRKGERRFELVIENPDFPVGQAIIKGPFTLTISGFLVSFHEIFILSRSNNQATGLVSSLYSIGFSHSSKYYNRLFIPLPLDFKAKFYDSIQVHPFAYSINGNAANIHAIIPKLKRKKFYLYVVKDNHQRPNYSYLVIDTKNKLSEKLFHKYTYAILLSLGFVSGHLLLNEGYYVQYRDKEMIEPIHFGYTRLRDSIKSDYTPVDSNIYSWLSNPQLSMPYKGKLRNVSTSEFSELCGLVFSKDEYKSILLLIIETARQSMVSSPAMLSVTLEALAILIESENVNAFAPVNKSIWNIIRPELLKTLKNYPTQLTVEETSFLQNKINNLNQVTNRNKLIIPFNILEINLNENDIYAIDQRNSFLHGSDPMIVTGNIRIANKSERFRYFLFLKLYTLVIALVLKRIGFNNRIVNYPKIYENETGVNLNEEYYRQI